MRFVYLPPSLHPAMSLAKRTRPSDPAQVRPSLETPGPKINSGTAWISTSPLRIPRTNLGKRSNPCEYTPSRLVSAKSCAQRKARSGRKPELHRGRARGHRKLPDTGLRSFESYHTGRIRFGSLRSYTRTSAWWPIQPPLKFVC